MTAAIIIAVIALLFAWHFNNEKRKKRYLDFLRARHGEPDRVFGEPGVSLKHSMVVYDSLKLLYIGGQPVPYTSILDFSTDGGGTYLKSNRGHRMLVGYAVAGWKGALVGSATSSTEEVTDPIRAFKIVTSIPSRPEINLFPPSQKEAREMYDVLDYAKYYSDTPIPPGDDDDDHDGDDDDDGQMRPASPPLPDYTNFN